MKPGRSDSKRTPNPPRQSHRERLEQAAKARRDQREYSAHLLAERAARLRAEKVANDSRPHRDAAQYCAVLASTPFFRAGEDRKLTVNAPYLHLVEAALRCMQEKTREAVLCWPDFEASPSALAALLTIADNAATAPVRHDGLETRAPPLGMRALVYPYARSGHRALKHVYIDKDNLSRLHTLHQVRSFQQGEDAALADYHKTLARTKTLTGMTLEGVSYAEYRHPCLDEILPSGPCAGSDGRSQLLWRVRTKTDLGDISRTGKADDPRTAKFYLFGLRAADALRSSLRSIARPIDVAVLDLTRVARNRLGRNWLARVQAFLAELDQQIGPLGTVAIADDPWTFDQLRFEGLKRPQPTRTRIKSEPSSIIFAQGSELVVPSQLPPAEYVAIVRQDAFGFSGEVESLLRRIRADARAATDLNDPITAHLLHHLAGTIRRCASLPGPREKLAQYVESEVGSLAAADLLASYRVGSLIAELKASIGPWAQHNRAELTALCSAIEKVSNDTALLTPMAPLLWDVVQRYRRVSSRTIIMFRNDMLADFASCTFCSDAEFGEQIESRIEKAMLLLTDKSGLDDLAKLPGPERNQIKTLIVVAPTRSQVLSLLALPWLPDSLIVLADSDTLSNAARDAMRLVNFRELAPIHDRLRGFADKASKAAHRHNSLPADPSDDPSDDVEFPISSVVNLAGNVRADQPTIRFELSGNQIVIARPGTKLILFDRTRAVPTFAEAEAKDVEEGDRICVIGDAFLEMARPLLNITARAAEEIRDYHRTVLERLSQIPGASDHERLAYVVSAMDLDTVTVQRASYWIDLQEQLNAPIHEVVPHAPRDRVTFLAFMKALGVSETIASHFWIWAVIAQRTSRLRAAMSFHDAYRTILIDSYAAQSSNPERARDIRRLKAAAEDFVSVVETKREQRGDRERS
jgi:hypothetical protein